MQITRRAALAALSAAPLLAQKPKPRLPSLCVASRALTGVGYAEMGEIVSQMGFDGVDIAVYPGGLVEPSLAPVDEVRAFESIHGAGLEAPIITTGLTTPFDPWCQTVLALAGRTGVGLAKCGLKGGTGGAPGRRDMGGLVYIGRQYKVQVLISAGVGGSEPTLAEALRLAGGLDPEWSGLALDSDLFAEGIALGEEQERMALSLAKAVTVSDFAGAAREPRPLGHGSVDFGRLFGTLAKAGFYGPVTVERRYKTGDEPGALTKDAEFARKQIQSAYAEIKT